MRFYKTKISLIKNQTEAEENSNVPKEYYWDDCYVDLECVEYFHANECQNGDIGTSLGIRGLDSCIVIQDNIDEFAKVVNNYHTSMKGIKFN